MKRTLLSLLGSIVFASFSSFSHAAPYTIAARTVNLNGYNLFCDSFDSSDTNHSTGGLYDPAKASDGAVVASEDGIFNANNVGNVEIWGRLMTASPFTLALGPASSIGSSPWHQSGQFGIEPGFHETNLDLVFPDAIVPFFGSFIPAGGTFDGVYYNYIFYNGDYHLPSLTLSGNQKALVILPSRLHVIGGINISGNAYVRILQSGSLGLYVGGPGANLRGNGIINEGVARNFTCFGLSGNTSVSIRMPTPFVGNLYVPNAVLTVNSAGSSPAEFVGGVVCQTLDLAAPVRFHADDAVMP